jgi:hypothetical protein
MEQCTFVGLHVPKCAGTTLLNRVQSSLPSDQIFQNTSIILNFQQKREDFLHIRAKHRLRFIWGHAIHEEMLKFFGPQTILITGLREPIERFRSELHYTVRLARQQRRPCPDIEGYIKRVRNPMCHFLIARFPTIAGETGTPADRAINVIDAFHYVYFSETFEETAGAIFKAMGISPKPVNSNIASEARGDSFDINMDFHKHDIAVYAHACARFRGVSPEHAFSATSTIFANFLVTPIKMNVLRDFLWNSAFNEYNNWKALPEVFEERKRQIEELEYEIATYRRLLEGEVPSSQEKEGRKAEGS